MLRPGRDYSQFRPGGVAPVVPSGPPSVNPSINASINPLMNITANATPPFAPLPSGGRSSHVSGGHFMYPLPPPTPVPSLHPFAYLPAVQAPPFVPPLPESPPVDAPPPPPAASPTAPPSPLSPPLSATDPRATTALSSIQPISQLSKPTDPEVRRNIEDMAEFVVKNGPRYESMARAKHAGDPKFAFLFDNASGPEAVIECEFYKWKKKLLQREFEMEGDTKANKHTELESDAWRGQQMDGKAEELPGSPAISDMDMEDDLVSPSPKLKSLGLSSDRGPPAKEPVSNKRDTSNQLKQQVASRSRSPSELENDFSEPSLNNGKQAQCRLTGDYRGSLIDDYNSDTSEGSEDLQLSENPNQKHLKKAATLLDQTSSSPQHIVNLDDAEDTEVAENRNFRQSQSAELLKSPAVSPSQVASGVGIKDVIDMKQKNGEKPGSDPPAQQRDLHGIEKGATESISEEAGSQQGKKKGRSYSRSRSRSRTNSRSRSRSRSRSKSQSVENGSKSPSPLRSIAHYELSSEQSMRTPPKELRGGVEKGDHEAKETSRRGAKGAGSNICLNYARGRCFRGDSCRLQHQGSVADKILDEPVTQKRGEVNEAEELGGSKITALSQNLEKKPTVMVADKILDEPVTQRSEVIDAEELGASKVTGLSQNLDNKPAVVVVESNARSETKDIKSEGKQSKRLKLDSEKSVRLPQDGISSLSPSAASNLLQQTSSGGLNPAKEGDSAAASTRPGPFHAEPAYSSHVTLPSSPQLDLTMQMGRNSSHVGQSYVHSNIESAAVGLHTSLKPPVPMSNAYFNTNNEAAPTIFSRGNDLQLQTSKLGIGETTSFQQLYPHGGSGTVQGEFRPGSSINELADLSRNYAPFHRSEYGPSFQPQSGNALQSVFPPSLSVNPAVGQQRDFSTDSSQAFTSLQHGFNSPALQPLQAIHPPFFRSDASRPFSFSSVSNHASYDAYPKPSHSSQIQSSVLWSWPGSLGFSSSKALDIQPLTGKSSSYSYALTTIPPLPSIIDVPRATNVSTSSDQYDPLSDSIEPGPIGGSNSNVSSFLKTGEDRKSFGEFSNMLSSRLENVSPGLDMEKDPSNMNEAVGDPVVGIVENVSPPEDDRNWSPGQPMEEVEAKQGQESSKAKKNNARGLKLLRSAVADHVKEVLKPTWKEGNISKDAFKNIVKKTVDKVTAALPSHHIPKSQEKADQFMSSSRTKITKLVQGYIDRYKKT